MRPIVEPAGPDALLIRRDGMTGDERIALSAVAVLCAVLAGLIAWAIRSGEEGRPLFVGSAALALVAMAGLGVALVRGAAPCTWRVDVAGVEYRPAAGPDRRVAWADVARVRWWPTLVILDTPDGRVALKRMTLPEAEWGSIRARVEAALTPRFDLTVRPPDVEFRPARVLLAFAPVGLAAAWFVHALPTLTIPQMHAGVYAMMALLVAPLPYLAWRVRSEQERRNPSWRRPRPTSQAWVTA